jgi:hypothetical protein
MFEMGGGGGICMLLGKEGRLIDAGLAKPGRAIWGGDWRGAQKAKLKGICVPRQPW